MTTLTNSFLNIPFPVWGIGALVIAAIFAVVVPGADKVNAQVGLNYVITRWFHSLVWVLLAVSFFLRAVQNETLNGLANPLAALAGLTYLTYMTTFISSLKS